MINFVLVGKLGCFGVYDIRGKKSSFCFVFMILFFLFFVC